MEYIDYNSINNADTISSGKLVIFENVQLLILTHKNIGEFTVHADTSVVFPKHASMSIQLSQEKRSSCITGLYPMQEIFFWKRLNISSPGRFLLRFADLFNVQNDVDICFLQDEAKKRFCNTIDVSLKPLMILASGQAYYEAVGYLPYNIDPDDNNIDDEDYENAYIHYPDEQKKLDILRNMSVTRFFNGITPYKPTGRLLRYIKTVENDLYMMHFAQLILDALYKEDIYVCRHISYIINNIKHVLGRSNYVIPTYYAKSYISNSRTLKRLRPNRFPIYTIDRIQAPMDR